MSVAIFDDEQIVGRANTWLGRYSLVYPEQNIMAANGDNGSLKTRRGRRTRLLALMVISFLLPLGVAAQSAAGQGAAGQAVAPSASELAKQTQNPIASLISFPLEGNWDMGVGDREATSTLLNVQPVIPFSVSQNTNVVLRVITPLMSQPSTDADGSRISGLGDLLLSAFLSPAKSGRLIWGIGPVVLLPTATHVTIGAEKFAVGPTAVVLTQPGNWTLGLLANQLWSTSGANDREDVNKTYLQPFMHYNLAGGLAVGASAEVAGNWEADDDTWSGPLLFSVSKVTVLGKRPVKLLTAAGPTFGPDQGPDWRFRFAATFLFPR